MCRTPPGYRAARRPARRKSGVGWVVDAEDLQLHHHGESLVGVAEITLADLGDPPEPVAEGVLMDGDRFGGRGHVAERVQPGAECLDEVAAVRRS